MQIDLTGFDIPERRLDTSKLDNVRWLLRNIGVQGRDHPQFSTVMEELKKALRTAT